MEDIRLDSTRSPRGTLVFLFHQTIATPCPRLVCPPRVSCWNRPFFQRHRLHFARTTLLFYNTFQLTLAQIFSLVLTPQSTSCLCMACRTLSVLPLAFNGGPTCLQDTATSKVIRGEVGKHLFFAAKAAMGAKASVANFTGLEPNVHCNRQPVPLGLSLPSWPAVGGRRKRRERQISNKSGLCDSSLGRLGASIGER